MTLFWTLAASLVALALALVLPALLKTRHNTAPRGTNLSILREQMAQLDAELGTGGIDESQYRQLRAELERRALEEEGVAEKPAPRIRSAGTAVMVGLAIPVLAAGLYSLLGNPQALSPGTPEGRADTASMAQVEAMVEQMAQRLENPPDGKPADPKAWEMLARSYAALQRFAEADRAYIRAIQLAPGNAQLLADRADALAMLQGQSAAGEPTRLIEQALKLEPRNLKALALAGSAAFERRDFPAAIRYWTQARELAPAGSDMASGLDRSLDEARAATGAAVPAAPAATENVQRVPDKSPAAGSISGSVRLAPALADKVAPDDTVFIFARAVQGPRMPLAILKYKARELPLSFTLDDSTAMSPELRLSLFDQVTVGVRISKSGNAMPQRGDLVGQAGPLKPGSTQLTLTVDRVQP